MSHEQPSAGPVAMKRQVLRILGSFLWSRGNGGELNRWTWGFWDTSFASGPRILVRSSPSRTDWKIADEMATPPTYTEQWLEKNSIVWETAPTWPTPLKSCPKPVPTAITDSEGDMIVRTMSFGEKHPTYGVCGPRGQLKKEIQ